MAKKKKQRIYGEDTGNLSQQTLNRLNSWLKSDLKRAELLAFLLYDQFDFLSWRYNHERPSGPDFPHTRETDKEYEEMQYARFYVIGVTKNFGVVFEPKMDGMPVYRSESFKKWYNFWRSYIYGLPESTWKKLDYAIFHEGDIREYLPEKTWNEV